MSSAAKLLVTAGLAALASAYTQPKTQNYAPIVLPDTTNPVTQGQTYKVQWNLNFNGQTFPSDGLTVSLVLCNGGSSNCVNQPDAIVSGVPASQQSYDWNVPCSVPVGDAGSSNGHGLLIIVDQTGDFQYSTQFGVLAGSCPSSSTTSNGSTTTTPSSSSSFSSSSSSTTGGANSTTVAPVSSTSATGGSYSSGVATGTAANPFSFGNSSTGVVTPTLTRASTTGATGATGTTGATGSASATVNAARQVGAGAGALVLAVGAAVLAL